MGGGLDPRLMLVLVLVLLLVLDALGAFIHFEKAFTAEMKRAPRLEGAIAFAPMNSR
jgi:uncharacterized protein YneF (UPF0154 family)